MLAKRVVQLVVLFFGAVLHQTALAEGSYQVGLEQNLYEYGTTHSLLTPVDRPLYVDILGAGEVINISLCGQSNSDNLRVQLRSPGGSLVLDQIINGSGSTGGVSCSSSFTTPLTNPLRYTTTQSGTYELRLYNNSGQYFRRFDVTVTPNSSTNPDPTDAAGRLWARSWAYNALTYDRADATNADYFILTPGGYANNNYVWTLDLNQFAGFIYEIIANAVGVDAPNSGLSTNMTGNSITQEYPVYLGYPAVADPSPSTPPTISSFSFIDNAGVDYGISPSSTLGIQDAGFFNFTTNVIGTYAITIDVDRNGIYDANDVLLLGRASSGSNSVAWNGRDKLGAVLPNAEYTARVQIRLGEYHFVAADAETSGGDAAGLTIYQALSGGGQAATAIYWDDQTLLGGTTTLPDGQVGGRHTWGNFTGTSFGNQKYIDTYVFGLVNAETTPLVITADDTPLAPETGTANQLASIVDSGNGRYTITLTHTLENFGNTSLNNLSVSNLIADDFTLANVISVQAVDGSLIANPAYDGVTVTELLASGQSLPVAGAGTVQLQLVIESGIYPGPFYNQFTASGADLIGTLSSDLSTNGLDPDNDGGSAANDNNNDPSDNSDPTPIYLPIDRDGDGVADHLDSDDDNDGIADLVENGGADPFADHDADGTPNYLDSDAPGFSDGNGDGIDDAFDFDRDGQLNHLDNDSDNDGIPDISEAGGTDANGDGLVDSFVDADGDGLADSVDASQGGVALTAVDADGDGLANFHDLDADGDGIADSVEAGATPAQPIDGDTDGRADYLDIDSDNDGITDLIEAQAEGAYVAPSGVDADSDGLDDAFDGNVASRDPLQSTGLSPANTDGADTPDYRDGDADNDGLPDAVEGHDADNNGVADVIAAGSDSDNDGLDDAFDTVIGGDASGTNAPLQDTDSDGVRDWRDGDADNDGIPNSVEFGADPLNPVDGDADGVPDYLDLDADNDGRPDSDEAGADPLNPIDSDSDGVADYRDLDADNDGIPDVTELGGVDADNDGQLDGFVDADGDGLADSVDADQGGTSLASVDSDSDGLIDALDRDSDNDGLADVIEAGGVDANGDGVTDTFADSNGNGLADNLETTPLPITDSDRDGLPDYRELDSDNDTLPDLIEAGGVDANTDGRVDDVTDADNDGLSDSVDSSQGGTPLANGDADGDGRPNARDIDADNDGILDSTEVGANVYAPLNSDADALPNYLDIDADNDGLPDNIEAQPTLGYTVPSGADADNDGLDDAYDSDNSNPNPNFSLGLTPQNSESLDTADYIDNDADNDGVTDLQEGQRGSYLGSDADSDGLDDGFDTVAGWDVNDNISNPATELPDSDGDVGSGGDVNYRDTAADGDGDGVIDLIDSDDDNDGIADLTEGNGVNASLDSDGDDIPDYQDSDTTGFVDSNSDGIDDRFDHDLDGVPNHLDLDSDNDGIPDVTELAGTDTDGDGLLDGFVDVDGDGLHDDVDASEGGTPLAAMDSDGDGIANQRDLDSDGDGLTDAQEAGANPVAPVDSDGDGIADYRDIDADNDGIVDLIEAQSDSAYIAPSGVDADSDGLDDAFDGDIASRDPALSAGLSPVNTDGADQADYLDNDSDNDGRSDAIEGFDTNNDGVAETVALGTDGDNDGLDDAFDSVVGGNATGGNAPLPDTDSDGVRDWRDGDADNDGIPDLIELGADPLNPIDSDGDGVPDYRDLDADNDGIPDSVEAGADPLNPVDTDGDGIADYLDLDADNDGVTDLIEQGGPDSNGDGRLDSSVDADGDGLADVVDPDQGGTALVNIDSDGDTLPDYLETDADNDGIPDVIESGGTDSDGNGQLDNFVDGDGDGLHDDVDASQNGTPLNVGDFDGDGVADYRDIDSDNDGLGDALEVGADPTQPQDSDGDNLADFRDIDADNDGLPDNIEAQPTAGYIAPSGVDADGDGMDGAYDADSGNPDALLSGGLTPVNSDNADLADYLDNDSDNDGLPDLLEGGRGTPAGSDSDNDGLDDGFDNIPGLDVNDDIANPATDLPDNNGDAGSGGDVDYRQAGGDSDNDGVDDRFDADDDNDGISDLDENNGSDPNTDSDSDGTPDYRDSDTVGFIDSNGDGIDDRFDHDLDGMPNHLDSDSDNDGIFDVTELGGSDADGDGQRDDFVDNNGDGLHDGPPLTLIDSDGDGINNQLDLDSDGDGISDAVEAGSDPATPLDSDNDGRPDYLDIDADGDGIVDLIEAQSEADYLPPSGVDNDGDGLDDAFDQDASSRDPLLSGGLTPVNSDGADTPDYLDTDTDNDGLPDVVEGFDANNDGVADTLASGADSDNDGLDDAFDSAVGGNPAGGNAPLADADADGLRDWRDGDADNDGIPNLIELGVDPLNPLDSDGDSVPDYRDLDADNDGTPDALEAGATPAAPQDRDGDGLLDYLDSDSDGDGISDALEQGGSDSDGDGRLDDFVDSDGDGLANTVDADNGGTPIHNTDSDGDGVVNRLDLDSDGDGLLDSLEAGSAPATPADSDGDGVADFIDIDADNDGLPDNIEAQTTAGYVVPSAVDVDSDGLDDAYDADTSDNSAALSHGLTPVNSDNADLADYLDSDSDNDGISDLLEGGRGTLSGNDTDGDGLDDGVDRVPGLVANDDLTDPAGQLPDVDNNANSGGDVDYRDLAADSDGDGVVDEMDGDSDNDGIPDLLEGNEVDPSLDSDNDGTPDYRDSDTVDFVDSNGDGVDDRFDQDLDGIPNHLDRDSDNDGISDLIEAGGSDANGDGRVDDITDANANGVPDVLETTPLNVSDSDGDGLINAHDLDSDNDGLLDRLEAGSDPANPVDSDADGRADYLDIDADNDGLPDNIEAQTTAGYVAPSGADVDRDGLDDAYDANINSPDDALSAGLTPNNHDGADLADYLDSDSDNDGLSDLLEGGRGSLSGSDADNDGLDDGVDRVSGLVSNDDITAPATQLPDGDGDAGLGGDVDFRDLAADSDGDGIGNLLDGDDDNDGIPDLTEGNGADPSLDSDADGIADYHDSDNAGFTDSNGDGVDDRFDADLDGLPNHLDLDSDNDGIVDLLEAGGSDANGDGRVDDITDANANGVPDILETTPLTVPDSDTDGRADYLDIDADGDGIPDTVEAQAEGADVAPLGSDGDSDGLDDAFDTDNGGVALIPVNSDGADLADYLDLDSDNDGVSDLIEGNDANHDGEADVAPVGSDGDNDGLDDAFDTVAPGVGNVVGSDVALQDSDGDDTRDWRDLNDDGDSLNTADEDLNGNGNRADDDLDADGVPEYLDTDELGHVVGNVYEDANRNRNPDLTEPFGDVQVRLYGAGPDGAFATRPANMLRILAGDDVLLGQTQTAADGSYRFDNKPVGPALVVIDSPDNSRFSGSSHQVVVIRAAEVRADFPYIDPAGVIYDSVTGDPIEGATVSIYQDNNANRDYDVGIDTLAYQQLTSANGAYAWAQASATSYVIEVTPPVSGGYNFPSSDILPTTAPDPLPDTLNDLDGQNTGVYYLAFTFAATSGDLINNDIPLDSLQAGSILLSKSAAKESVVIGDMLAYTIEAENTLATDLSNVTIQDKTPAGFKLVEGSTQLIRAGDDGELGTADDVVEDVTVNGQRPLDFTGINFAGSETLRIRYLLTVGSGVLQGEQTNYATPYQGETTIGNVIGNTAQATVTVTADPIFDTTTIIGKVFHDRDGDGWQDNAAASGVVLRSVMLAVASEITLERGGEMQSLNAPSDGTLQLGELTGRSNPMDAPENHRMVIRARLADEAFSGLGLRSAEGTRLTIDAEGNVATAHRGQLADGLSGQDLRIEQRIDNDADGKWWVITITNHGIHELGIPGVRIASPTGLLMETDRHGRYHLADVDFGRFDRGRNVILKVDDKTLPKGATFTTENPRVMRIDSALMGRIDFGVDLPEQAPIAPLRIIETPAPKPAPVVAAPIPRYETVERVIEDVKTVKLTDLVKPVRFASGRSDIRLSEVDVLREVIGDLKDKRNLRLHFIGHTDNERLSARARAKYGDNYGLALDRATKVGNMFKNELGLPDHMVTSEGMGPDQPLAGNDTPEGMALNRRVEIQVRYDEISQRVVQEQRKRSSESVAPVPAKPTAKPQVKERLANLQQGAMLWTTEDPYVIDPRLDVLAVGPVLQEQGALAAPLDFRLYSNYPAFIERWELQLFAGEDRDRVRPLAILSGSVIDIQQPVVLQPEQLNGVQLTGHDGLFYVLRVFDGEGRWDETAPRPLEIIETSRHEVDNEAAQRTLDSLYGSSNLAQRNIPVVGSRVRLHGAQVAPGYQLAVNGEAVAVDEQGSFVVERYLPLGEHTLKVDLVDQQGQHWPREVTVNVTGDHFFMVGIADLTVGQNTVSGSVEPLAADDRYDESLFADGRVAFYLKGKVKGKYLITAQLDSEEQALDELFEGLNDKDPRNVFRNLDPDRYYPVYGDDSTVIDDTDSQGRFYVRVEWDQSLALWGNYHTGMTGTEYAQYNRSLYGAKLAYRSTGQTGFGDSKLEVNTFVAEAQSVLGHNEFLATGGSLYYLRHTNVVQGSEKLRVEVRMRDGERVLDNITLERGRDYQFDDLQGRIILLRPLHTISNQGAPSIIKDAPLDGNRVYLIADYEYPPDGLDMNDATYGVRAKGWIGDHVAVGGSYVQERRDDGTDYDLQGVDVTIKLSQGSYIKGEVAQSSARQSNEGLISSDGGLSFDSLNSSSAADSDGQALALEGHVDLGELTDGAQPGSVTAWWKQRDADFSSARMDNGTETEERGAEARIEATDDLTVSARISQLDRSDVSEEQTLSVQADYRTSDRTTVSAEVRNVEETTDGSDAEQATLAAVKLGHDLSDDVNVYGIVQGTLDRNDDYASNNLLTLGAQARLSEKLALRGEGSVGNRGRAATLGLDYARTDRHSLYSHYTVSSDRTDGRRDVYTIGQRVGLTERLNVFHENQFSEGDRQAGVANVFGVDFDVNDFLRAGLSLQSSRIDDVLSGDIDRDAATITLGGENKQTRFSSMLEFRRDQGSEEKRQWLTANQFRHRYSEQLTWLGKLNLSQTKDQQDGRLDARFAEAGLGLAYRPIYWNRLNLLGKYTYLHDLPSEAQRPEDSDELAHVLALEGLYDLTQRWTLGGKLAGKQSRFRDDRDRGDWYSSRTNFAAINARYHFIKQWDALAEYRWLDVEQAEDSRQGVLLSVSRHVGEHMKLGVGYNFTEFNDDLTRLDYRAQGWFINLVGKY